MDRLRNPSTPSSKSTLALSTPTDLSSFGLDPEGPYVVNGTAIFINRGAAADIWLVETIESKYIVKALRLNLEHLSTSQAKKNSLEGINKQDDPAQRFTQYFRSKAGSWTSLEHQNVIKVFGLGERLDLRVEFCENGTARKYIDQYDDDINRKKLLIQHVLDGMVYLHSQSPPIVHGCLRADKIFVTADGTAKVGEFGLSLLTRDFALHAPSISQVGLSRWMSPELVDIDPDTGTIIQTTASDVWALACTLLEIMSGEIPYARHKHELKVRKAIIKGEQPGIINWSYGKVPQIRLLADPPIADIPSLVQSSGAAYSTNQTEVRSGVSYRRCDRCIWNNMICTFDPPNAAECQRCSSKRRKCVVSLSGV
ncbi:hypothetical protein FRC12_013064 [Ceratobasidium sp. 428]|nr:hypothetical protein FRC12_013064 [Ceratobasidium sp. 428]